MGKLYDKFKICLKSKRINNKNLVKLEKNHRFNQ